MSDVTDEIDRIGRSAVSWWDEAIAALDRAGGEQWKPQLPPDFCSHCGASWQCEHRVQWSPPGTVVGPPIGELRQLDDRARELRRHLPGIDVTVSRCHGCRQWGALIGWLCEACSEDAAMKLALALKPVIDRRA